jgi:molybdopterin converting factor small subunit
MSVTVKLFATFQKGRFATEQRECPPGTTIASLVDALGIARAEIGVLLVGGRHVELEHVPVPGDSIAIFPLLGGG